MKETETKKPSHLAALVISVVAAMALIVFLCSCIYQNYLYTKAKDSAFAGDYTTATQYLDKMSELTFNNANAISNYCFALQYYEHGEYEKAHYSLLGMSLGGRIQGLTAEQEAILADFRATVDKEYNAYLEQQAAWEAQEIRDGVPYVGMKESQIRSTSLGSPSSEVRHNNECIGGQQYEANLYDFYSGKKVIFTARCVRGKVTEVWDNRDRTYTPSYSGHVTSSDPYDVDEYVHPDDFYYDHIDDFFDYEDAEDYYNEHHD